MFKELNNRRLSLCDLLVRERVLRSIDQRHPRNAAALKMNLNEQEQALGAIQDCLSKLTSSIPTTWIEPLSCALDREKEQCRTINSIHK